MNDTASNEFDLERAWEYENGFYLTSDISRIPKLLAHFELYKQIVNLPGHIVECGVFKGASFSRFLTFREILESPMSRKVVGFDVFGEFPRSESAQDNDFISQFETTAGNGLSREMINGYLDNKGLRNYELIRGDILETVPNYVKQHPELRIAMLHVDVDVYEPSRVVLETLFDRVVTGGLVVLDDYGTVGGETQAVDEFVRDKGILLQKLPISHVPTFFLKN